MHCTRRRVKDAVQIHGEMRDDNVVGVQLVSSAEPPSKSHFDSLSIDVARTRRDEYFRPTDEISSVADNFA